MKQFISNLLLIIGIVLLVNALGNWFFPLTQGDAGIVRKQKEAFGSAIDHNPIFMGSSRTYRHIDPQLFDRLIGQPEGTSYNFGVPATFAPEIFYFYEQMLSELESKGSRTIIMELQEISLLAPKNLISAKGNYWLNNDYLIFSITALLASDISTVRKSVGVATFITGWFINHLGFNYLSGSRSEKDGRALLEENGFACMNEAMANKANAKDLWVRRNEFLNDTTELQKRAGRQQKTWASVQEENGPIVNLPLLEKLNHLIKLSAKKNVNLIFILPPRLTNYKTVLPLGKALGHQRFFDLSSPDVYPQLWEVKSSFDAAHMNCEGASLYTRALVDQLEGSNILME